MSITFCFRAQEMGYKFAARARLPRYIDSYSVIIHFCIISLIGKFFKLNFQTIQFSMKY